MPIDRAKTWEAMQPLGHQHRHQRSSSGREPGAPHATAQQPGTQGSLLSYSGRPKARQSTGRMQAINNILCDDRRRVDDDLSCACWLHLQLEQPPSMVKPALRMIKGQRSMHGSFAT